jgi:hypothetical protein
MYQIRGLDARKARPYSGTRVIYQYSDIDRPGAAKRSAKSDPALATRLRAPIVAEFRIGSRIYTRPSRLTKLPKERDDDDYEQPDPD